MSFLIWKEFGICSLPEIRKQNVPSMKNKHKQKEMQCVLYVCIYHAIPVHHIHIQTQQLLAH